MPFSSRANSLCDMIQRHGWKAGAELGVWQGETTFSLLAACPALHMIAVDRWERYGGPKNKDTGMVDYTHHDMVEAEMLFRQRAQQYEKQLLIIKGDSALSAMLVKDGTLDFVFIDADHRTHAVTADIVAWLPKVRSHGAMLGHDADWNSVQEALHVVLDNIAYLPGNVWLSWKR